MHSINLADAKTHLSALVEQAASGEPVRIVRRGRPIAQITAIHTPRRPIDPVMLRRVTAAMPVQAETAGIFIRTMRDDERY